MYLILCLSILTLFATFSIYIYYNVFKIPKKLSHIPAPTFLQCASNMLNNDPLDVKIRDLNQAQLNKTKVQAYFRFGGWGVLVSSAKTIKTVLNDTVNFPKRIPIEEIPTTLIAKFMGVNVVFTNHELWKRHRKILNPPFKKQFKTEVFTPAIINFFNLVDNKFNNTNIDIYKYMQRITMDALGLGILGLDFQSVINENVPFLTAYNTTVKAMFDPLYGIIYPLDSKWNPFRRQAWKTLDELEEHFTGILKEKRQILNEKLNSDIELGSDEDILTLMLKASQQEDIQFSDKEMRDNIMVFLLAGHETTADALSVALHFFAKYPDVQNKARKEVIECMELDKYNNSDIDNINIPTTEQCKNMNYLMAVIKESLRLYPSSPRISPRICKQDTMLDGYLIPAGTEIDVDLYCMQRDSDNFKEPEKFKPERFLNHSNNNNWFPFSDGTRACIGINFSYLEQKLVLALILSRYCVKYTDPCKQDQPLALTNSLLFTPDNITMDFELL